VPNESIAQREPSCDCIELTNAALLEHGTELPLVLNLSGGPTTIEIRLVWLDDSTAAKRGRRGKSAPVLMADFCPLCGIKYGWKPPSRVAVMTRSAS
jgi:hypothetical protein